MGILIIAFWEFFLAFIPFVLAFLLYRKLRRNYKVIGVSVLVLIIGIEIYRWFTVFNPTDGFYQNEFVQATDISLPDDAEIIAKKSDVPWHLHFMGYEATFLVKCNGEGYEQLIQHLQRDTSFSVVKEMRFWSDRREDMLRDKKLDKAQVIFFKQTQAGESIYVEFFTDKNLLLICKNSV